jgi:hypothetical protein
MFSNPTHSTRHKSCLFIFSFFLSLHINCQVYISTKADYLKSKTEQNNMLSEYQNNYPDTTVTELHNYFPRNFMGNPGLSSPAYLLKYGTPDLGFIFFRPPQVNDRFTVKDITYYRSLGPYAGLTGIAGSKQLQAFKMLFTHTYHDKVNFTLRFNRYTSQGYYVKQQTYTNNFFLTSNYSTKNKRAGYYLYLLNNGNKNSENGGISDGVITDSTLLYNKDLLRVRLNGATRDNREFGAMLNPWIRLNKSNDSLRRMDHYLQLKSRLDDNSFKYTDRNSSSDGYYTIFNLDTLATKDSSHVRQFVNEVSYSLLATNGRLGFSAGYRNEVNNTWQLKSKTFLNNMVVSDLVYRIPIAVKDTPVKTKRYLVASANAQYVISGFNKQNLKHEERVTYVFNENKSRDLFLNVLYEKRTPDYIYNNWTSNHFEWTNNGLGPQEQFQVRTGIHLGKIISASVFYQEISNYLYFDQVAQPRQYNKRITNTAFTADVKKIFFRHLGISVNYVHQLTSNTSLVRLPSNVTTAKLFYNGSHFKNILQLQIGGQIQLYEPFVPYAYMPATQVFYLQNQFKTSGYPYLDVYLNARIRPVSFFLKVENVLQGLAGPGYSFVPGYYQPDRAFRFGITWMFFD